MMTNNKPTYEERSAEEVAILFHETYEKLAPSFGYETRKDTKIFDPLSKNGKLMIAVCSEVMKKDRSKISELEKEVEILKNERHEFQKDSRQDKG